MDLQPCDAKALLDNEPEPVKTVLEGVNVHRGHGVVRADDGRQAELATVTVDAWHIKEHGEEELPKESLGQLHEGDTYIIRWTYSITTLGESGGKKKQHARGLFNDSLQSYSEFSSVFVSGEAAETRRAERRCSWKREDRLLFLARPSLQCERERYLGSDDGGAG